jgi:hypothetical protein
VFALRQAFLEPDEDDSSDSAVGEVGEEDDGSARVDCAGESSEHGDDNRGTCEDIEDGYEWHGFYAANMGVSEMGSGGGTTALSGLEAWIFDLFPSIIDVYSGLQGFQISTTFQHPDKVRADSNPFRLNFNRPLGNDGRQPPKPS